MTPSAAMNWAQFWDRKATEPADFAATGRSSMDVVGFLHTAREVARILELAPGDRLLDIGCGTGIMALALSPAVAAVHGIDISPAMIERAECNCAGYADITFTVGSITAPGVKAGTFDKVLAYSVLQYLPDANAAGDALTAIAQVLPSGGVGLLAANPDPGRKQVYLDQVMASDRDTAAKENIVSVTEQTLWLAPAEAEALARQAGLEPKICPIDRRIWQHFYMYDLVVAKP